MDDDVAGKKYKTFVIPGRCFEVDNRYFRLGFGAPQEETRQSLKNFQDALAEVS